MEEQEWHTDRFLRTKKIENLKKEIQTFLSQNAMFITYLRESLDFFKVGILRRMNNIKGTAEEIVYKNIIFM